MRRDRDVPVDDAARTLTRRALLRSGATAGAGVVAGAYSLRAPAAGWAGLGGRRIDGAAIQRLFDQAARELLTPGAFLVLRSPRGNLTTAYGSGHLTRDAELRPTDRFRIGSVTKTFTGTLIMQLAQRGELRLTDPVSRYRPGVPNGRRITIEQLMAMHSGLYNYTLSRALNRTMDRRPLRGFSTRELLRISYRARPHPVPGQGFEYSNTNTVLLGLIAEQLSGAPLAELYRTRLFAPLGMRDTTMPTSGAIPGRHPRGYMYGTNVSTLKSEKLPPSELAAALAGRLKPRDVTDANPSWAGAAGAAISSPRDVATWVEGLGNGSLLNRSWQRRRLHSVRPIAPGRNAPGYGLALASFGALYGHTGEIPGFQTFAGYDPVRRVTLVVLTNLKASPEGLPPAATIAQRLIEELYR